jgi:serine/threonine protein kinase
MAKISDYELLQQIGSGTYSIVHKAINKRTRELCAIKVMQRKKFVKSNNIDNLIKEISILKSLEHKYIVKMYDFSWDSENIYLIMELCETSLSSIIRKRSHLCKTLIYIIDYFINKINVCS